MEVIAIAGAREESLKLATGCAKPRHEESVPILLSIKCLAGVSAGVSDSGSTVFGGGKMQMQANCPLLDRSVCMCLSTAENGCELWDMCKMSEKPILVFF